VGQAEYKERRLASAKSLIKVMTVITVMGVLAAFSWPSVNGYQQTAAVKEAILGLEKTLAKARSLAGREAQPVRVVINCSRPQGYAGCFVDLERAIIEGSEITGWRGGAAERLVFDEKLTVVRNDLKPGSDGKIALKGIHWIVYKPQGATRSEPLLWDLFVFDETQESQIKGGWSLSVDQRSGLTASNREKLIFPRENAPSF
jgi:Tfp pilus assembly protein FimT